MNQKITTYTKWFKAIKFNIIALLGFLSVWLIFIMNDNYYKLNDKLLLFLFLNGGPIIAILFCYFTFSNKKIGFFEFKFIDRYVTIFAIILLFLITPGSVGLAGPLVFFTEYIPFLYAIIAAEIFRNKIGPSPAL
jgi:hypothetical protein